jgi:hypothetical protein
VATSIAHHAYQINMTVTEILNYQLFSVGVIVTAVFKTTLWLAQRNVCANPTLFVMLRE